MAGPPRFPVKHSDRTAHVRSAALIAALFLLYQIRPGVFCQTRCSDFVGRSGSSLVCGNLPWYGVGVNCYYLQNLAAYGDTDHCNEVFSEAERLGVTVIRTWGFFDDADSSNPAVIQWAPGELKESGLRALDYVLAKAKEHSVRLIIPMVNNWEDYGGMNQYVRWYAEQLPGGGLASVPSGAQRVITGAGRRQYRYLVSGALTHDDFYAQPVIQEWYKNYIAALVRRTNTLTGTTYRDDPTILAWELANEPRSSDPTGDVVSRWMGEISAFLKSLDPNHLVSSGEEGLDCDPDPYGGAERYNQQEWLFNGTAGISFSRNTALPSVDIASVHCYPDAWHITMNQGVAWLKDHQKVAGRAQKPVILGEVGVRSYQHLFYEAVLNEGYFDNTAGILLWQLVYPGRGDNDGYAFSCPADAGICDVIAAYAERFEQKRSGAVAAPAQTLLLQNYPNPFREVTAISYALSAQSRVRLEIFTALGQSLGVLADEEQPAGVHVSLLDGRFYSSGIYFLRLVANGQSETRRVTVAK
jgi:mannan endo-1,4-beta-mannosidase